MWFLMHAKGLSLMDGEFEVERLGSGRFTTESLTQKAGTIVVDLQAPEPKAKPATSALKRSPACDKLVTKWEGYHTKLPNGDCEAYFDPGSGNLPITIGYGCTKYHTVKRFGRTVVRMGDTLTHTEALAELAAELDICERGILSQLDGAKCTVAMLDSLVSFAFNLGLAGASQQIERVKMGKYEECAAMFVKYNKAVGKLMQGLTNRRKDEEKLFRSQPFPVKE